MQNAIRHNSLVDHRPGRSADAISGGHGACRSNSAASSHPEMRTRVRGDERKPKPGLRLVGRAMSTTCRMPESSVSDQPTLFPETARRLPALVWAALVLERTLCG